MSESALPVIEPVIERRAVPSVKDTFKHDFLDNLFYIQGKFPALATQNDYYQALAYAVRDHLLQRWVSTAAAYTRKGSRTVAYLSAEFLMGPHLGNNLINLGMFDEVRDAIRELGLDFEHLLQLEEEPGLGNGGLGRLAACFIDSLATLEIPSVGYGIRYEFGIFHQEIVDGWQQERTDNWLRFGNPWEIVRPEWAVEVKLRGYTESYRDEHDRLRVRWVPHKEVMGIPYDTPILGYHNNTANTLRLWKSEASESFDFSIFNRGDYAGAVNHKVASENLSKVLYPNDEHVEGKELRLEQQYFFVTLLAAGHVPHPAHAGTARRQVPREVRGPDERHASGHRGGRAHATAHRRARDAVGRGVVHHHAHLRLHQPHAAAGSTRVLAARAVPARAAAASGDHLRDQRALPRCGAHPLSRRRRDPVAPVADRRARRALRAHGASGLRGQPRDQRRRGAALRAAEDRRAAGFPRALAAQVPEQDQWRDAASLDGARQSAPREAHQLDDRRWLDHGSQRAA